MTIDIPEEEAPAPAPVRPFVASFTAAPDPVTRASADSSADALGVRPYLLTSGRTGPRDASLAIESQVLATDAGRASLATLTFEHRDIVGLCVHPQSIAEIAASLRLHLGVVRVLVGDLSEQSYLSVYRPNPTLAHDVEILRRVIRGLESL